MNPTRREILRLGLGSSSMLACGTTVPGFLARSASALADAPSTKGRILVVLQLDGGNDGLNTVIPYRDDIYRRSRPRLQIPAKDVKTIDDRVGLHPSLGGFADLVQEGRLAVVQGVGYPNPNRSHFESMTIWQTAHPTPDAVTPGWLAKALDRVATSGGDAPGLHVQDRFPVPRALLGGAHPVASLDRLEQFRRRIGVLDATEADRQRHDLDRLAQQHGGGPGSLLQFVERCSLISHASSERLEALKQDVSSSPDYPEYYGLARSTADDLPADQGRALHLDLLHPDGWVRHPRQPARTPQEPAP